MQACMVAHLERESSCNNLSLFDVKGRESFIEFYHWRWPGGRCALRNGPSIFARYIWQWGWLINPLLFAFDCKLAAVAFLNWLRLMLHFKCILQVHFWNLLGKRPDEWLWGKTIKSSSKWIAAAFLGGDLHFFVFPLGLQKMQLHRVQNAAAMQFTFSFCKKKCF